MSETETKHKKEMNKIKSKLDVLIKKDRLKINRLDKKKYYKIFENFLIILINQFQIQKIKGSIKKS